MPELLTVEETAQALRVDERTVRRMLSDGRLQGANLGRVWRIHRASVLELIAAGTGARVFVLEMVAAGSGRTWSTTAHRTLAGAQTEGERRAPGSLGIGSDDPHGPVEWARDAEAPGGPEWAGTIGGQMVARISERQVSD